PSSGGNLVAGTAGGSRPYAPIFLPESSETIVERDKLRSFQISNSSNLTSTPEGLVDNNNVIYNAELDVLANIAESDSLEKKKATGSLSKEKGADVLPLILPVVTRVRPVLRDQDVNSSPFPGRLIFSAGLADTRTIQEPITSTKLRKPNLKTLARKKGNSSSSPRENLTAKRKIEAGGSLFEMDKKQRQVLVKNMNALSAQAVSQPRREH
ncbi:hypothetical protein TorRG33x02_343280, partial [Trema orientale]